MGQQQISLDDAFPIYQKRCGELHEETLLLRAHVASLERQLAEAQEENARLKQGAEQSAPVSGGPDLAAVPPFPAADER